MFHIQVYNNISPVGLAELPNEQYEISTNANDPDAILLRSHDLHNTEIPPTVKAIARAGAGTNNIPIDEMTRQGIPVFNTPGANANAVKELVLAGMLLAARHICRGWEFACQLDGDDKQMQQEMEENKKQFVGFELPQRTLAIIGLGAVGVKVANAAMALGMHVIGYDPCITIQRAWELSSNVEKAPSIEAALNNADFVSIHVPLNEHTQNLLNHERIKLLPKGAVILNFARAGIVDEDALCEALTEEHIRAYVCDFPSKKIKTQSNVIALPHLGASTKEAEENCARMATKQLRQYLEDGTIENSVNFPELYLKRNNGFRLAIVNDNVPNMVGQISTALADANLNIIDMINKSRGDIAFTLVDVNQSIPESVINELQTIEGVLNVNLL